MNLKIVFLLGALVTATFLNGCGGGGSTSVATPATSNFPLLAAYKSRINSGSTDNFSISGTCPGTATFVSSTVSAGTFEGIPALTVAQTVTANFTNCTLSSNAITGTVYYDTNYAPLGSIIPNTEYSRYQALPVPIPTTVKVGDTAQLATLDVYTNSTKVSKTGQRVVSYLVEQDTSNSVLVTLITKSFNTTNQPLATQQTKYRLTDLGALALVSIDIQYSTTSTARLLYTKI